MTEVDRSSTFLFVGAPQLAMTQLRLYHLNQLNELGSQMALAWGMHRPHGVEAYNVIINAIQRDSDRAPRLSLVRPRGQYEGEIDLDQPHALDDIVMFGYEAGCPLAYARVRIHDSQTGQVRDYDMPKSKHIEGPLLLLHLKD